MKGVILGRKNRIGLENSSNPGGIRVVRFHGLDLHHHLKTYFHYYQNPWLASSYQAKLEDKLNSRTRRYIWRWSQIMRERERERSK